MGYFDRMRFYCNRKGTRECGVDTGRSMVTDLEKLGSSYPNSSLFFSLKYYVLVMDGEGLEEIGQLVLVSDSWFSSKTSPISGPPPSVLPTVV